MKDDDPEKRIRELERELADVQRGAQPPGSPPRGGFGTPTYGTGYAPPRRKPALRWYTVVFLVATVLSVLFGVVAIVRVMVQSGGLTPVRGSATAPSGPTEVPHGGELRLSDNNSTRTVACNDGKLTLAGFHENVIVTGHCASLIAGGYSNDVTVDSADTLESTGYSNSLTDHACNNATVKLSSYGIVFNGAGHCGSIAISSYDNHVTVDSVDSVIVSGYSNDVTYRQGAPKVTNSGYDNTIHQG
ncbi:DUF3060 domain-containing protein [Mycobacterium sp. Marseille-P9652]|uniref:DUF3060 domain-containing protein n=1 Tax=Mycobacterium sp. Marseille-P9652 TaxID=2654950 RepID=UPI0018CFFA50|nr:DUF3060 domain-containing protein [Mycobacterium sp. Marseille-P9652]